MRFSEAGPDFPLDLITELNRGKVVFLCGAGVSRRVGLRDFKELTRAIFEKLGEDFDPFERRTFEQDKFDECLGSLSRRIVSAGDITRVTAELLQIPSQPQLESHTILLRLSAGADGTQSIVTTNFDTLFERALQAQGATSIRELSSAASSIPAPGSTRFRGVIHLHGRLRDEFLQLEETDLVLTSAQFGAAYLRDGWASRFIFDLVRAKSVVLIGYRAADPPIRYILNVLDADRERFPDLNVVYALAAREQDESIDVATANWEALGVAPILYEPQDSAHDVVWQDLGTLAEYVTRPRDWLREKLAASLAKKVAGVSEIERDYVAAAFTQHEYAWSILAENADASWLAFLQSRNLIGLSGVPQRAIASWAARRLGDRAAFRAVLEIVQCLRSDFGNVLLFGLMPEQLASVEPVLALAWRMLCHIAAEFEQQNRAENIAALDRTKKGSRLSVDLQHLVELAVPRLELRPLDALELRSLEEERDHPPRLRDLCGREMELDGDSHAIDDVMRAIPANDPIAVSLLDATTSELIKSLRLGQDAQLIGAGYDLSDLSVPSIEPHAQNEIHGGYLKLVELAVELFKRVLALDVVAARAIAARWRVAGFRLTTRLWLHALRNEELCSDDEAMRSLTSLDGETLLSIPREVPLAIRDRLRGAAKENIAALIELCVSAMPRIFIGPPSESEPPEWREVARDRAMWRILSSAASSGAEIPEHAMRLFEEIKSRRDWLRHPLAEQDYFSIWSGGVRTVVGRPELLREAPESQRIAIAERLTASPDPEDHESWNAFCRSDFEGALRTLLARLPESETASLWGRWMWAVPVGSDPQQKTKNAQLLGHAFRHLETASPRFLDGITYDLIWGYTAAAKLDAQLATDWWERLWASADRSSSGTTFAGSNDPDVAFNAVAAVLNSSGGRLADYVVQEISRRNAKRGELSEIELGRLNAIVASNGVAGAFGRGALVMEIPFVHYHAEAWVAERLMPALAANNDQARFLRSILIGAVQLPTVLSVGFWPTVLRSAQEFPSEGRSNDFVAVNLLRGCLPLSVSDHEVESRRAAARQVLRHSSEQLRTAVISMLATWLEHERPEHQSTRWGDLYAPLFTAIWPKGRVYRRAALSNPLVRLMAASGDAFPKAFELLRPYVLPDESAWPHLPWWREERRTLAQRFPNLILCLLWALYGANPNRSIHGLEDVLLGIQNGNPSLVSDRRFHALQGMVLPFR